jgi:prepilin-type N-terminal cleavage/methylation domain-containing protein
MTVPDRLRRLAQKVRRPAAPTGDAGFTLIEVVVSFAIFAIVAASAGTAIYKAIHASHLSQQRTEAAGVAQSIIANAIAKANDNTAIPEAGVSILSTIGGPTSATSSTEQFTAVRTITFDGGGTTCSPGTLFTVNVVVKQAQSGAVLARSDTRIACPPA